MKCRKARIWLSIETDGELVLRRKVLVGQHLHDCRECSNYRVTLTGIEKDIAATSFPKVSANFYSKVMSKLDREPESVRSLSERLSFRWATAIAFLLIGSFIGGLLAISTANRLFPMQHEDVLEAKSSANELLYFAAIPASSEIKDLFRQIVYGKEVNAP